jgi:hypothetical protein
MRVDCGILRMYIILCENKILVPIYNKTFRYVKVEANGLVREVIKSRKARAAGEYYVVRIKCPTSLLTVLRPSLVL